MERDTHHRSSQQYILIATTCMLRFLSSTTASSERNMHHLIFAHSRFILLPFPFKRDCVYFSDTFQKFSSIDLQILCSSTNALKGALFGFGWASSHSLTVCTELFMAVWRESSLIFSRRSSTGAPESPGLTQCCGEIFGEGEDGQEVAN
jgi:hypothetical protein